MEKLPEDLRVKSEKEKSFEGETKDSTCLLNDDCPGEPNALQESKHYNIKNPTQLPQISDVDAEKSEPAVSTEAGEANLSSGQPPLKNLLSLLKAYYALNAQPSSEELAKIADSVNLPLDVVQKWFKKMQAGQISVPSSRPSSPEPDKLKDTIDKGDHTGLTNEHQDSTLSSVSPFKTDKPLAVSTGSAQNSSRNNTPPLSPLNLSSSRNSQGYSYLNEDTQEEPQIEPLDLSLPKQHGESLEQSTITSVYQNSAYSVQEEPLYLTCAKKEPQKEQYYRL